MASHAIQSDDAFYGKGAKRSIPEEKELAEHLVRKGTGINDLEAKLEVELKDNQQLKLYHDLELPLVVYFSGYGITRCKSGS